MLSANLLFMKNAYVNKNENNFSNLPTRPIKAIAAVIFMLLLSSVSLVQTIGVSGLRCYYVTDCEDEHGGRLNL